MENVRFPGRFSAVLLSTPLSYINLCATFIACFLHVQAWLLAILGSGYGKCYAVIGRVSIDVK